MSLNWKETEKLLSELPLEGSYIQKITEHSVNSYTFSIRSRDNLSWAVINEGDWYRSWSVDSSTGAMRITVVPQKAGDLKLSVQRPGDDGYLSCVKYTVR